MRDLAHPCRTASRIDGLSCAKGCKKGYALEIAEVPPRSKVPKRHCSSSRILHDPCKDHILCLVGHMQVCYVQFQHPSTERLTCPDSVGSPEAAP